MIRESSPQPSGSGVFSRRTIAIAFIASLGGLLFGFDASVISGVIQFIKPEFGLSDLQLGWVVSSPSISAMFSMLIAGTLSNKLGRKPLLIIIGFLFALSSLLSAFALNYYLLVVARMIGGLAFGAVLILVPMYIAEIAPANNRGGLVSIEQLNIVIGFSVAYFSNYLIMQNIEVQPFITENNAWRWMFGAELFPATLYFLLLFIVPRSPRWLYLANRGEKGHEILQWLHGEQMADQEEVHIKESIQRDVNKSDKPVSELMQKGVRFVLLLGLFLGILQQIVGVNAIYFYATEIFEQSGIGTNASFARAIWVGLTNVVFTLLAIVLIDKMGRRPLLLIGVTGVALSMLLTSYGFYQATYSLSDEDMAQVEKVELEEVAPVLNVTYTNDIAFKNALKDILGEQKYAKAEGDIIMAAIHMNPYLILIGILGFVASFAFSLGPVIWVMLSELFPNRLRGFAISIIGLVNSLVSSLVQFMFPWELSNFGNALTYLIFAVFAVIGLAILFKVLPETKGKSLEEIEKDLVIK